MSAPATATHALPRASPDKAVERCGEGPRIGRAFELQRASAAPVTLLNFIYGADQSGNQQWRKDNKTGFEMTTRFRKRHHYGTHINDLSIRRQGPPTGTDPPRSSGPR